MSFLFFRSEEAGGSGGRCLTTGNYILRSALLASPPEELPFKFFSEDIRALIPEAQSADVVDIFSVRRLYSSLSYFLARRGVFWGLGEDA
jgi:hypothetical protein